MHKYLKHILIYSLILIYSCTDKVKEPTNTQQANDNKNFNTIINGFNTAIEILRKNVKKSKKGEIQLQNPDNYKTVIDRYEQFISWIEKNPDKKKELDTDLTEAYNWLEKRRAENASEKTLAEYINDALDCKNSLCKDLKKYGTYTNQIDTFFRINSHEIFFAHNNPEDQFVKFQKINISFIKDNF
ncbi:Mlp lipoprotein family protein (plasmid) [Borrelia crocidurae DOU]|uniref:Mlp lipoprotein family protein n=1 Tax=Borrelia crocidurae DOU TaxID=1293575 RepID=W5SM68_9SPIR|nr:Mlp family lipoprotein [Borrelia crocidurae]AHH07950.1 Mlp lipoprotein family protein [Borrelia crocidurae DOU]